MRKIIHIETARDAAVVQMAIGRVFLVVLAMVAVCVAASANDGDATAHPEDIKAAFIYKFTGYITWPEDQSETFTIAVLGNDPITESLKQIAEKKTVGAKKLVVKQCAKLEEISGSQLVVLSDSAEEDLEPILKKAKEENILTVSGNPGLAKKGVAINFCQIEDRIGFEMNLATIKASGLGVSSQLVKLAILVEGDKQSDEEGRS